MLLIESLESRMFLHAAYPTAAEQYMVELINRARKNPDREAERYDIQLNEGLAAGTISSARKQPLAINPLITAAARLHSTWMLDADVFSHTGAGGSSPSSRVQRTHAIPPLILEDWRRSLPQEDCMEFAQILALDLGKFKTVCCVMDIATRTHVFETIVMSPANVHDLIARHLTTLDPSATLVVFETCDTAGWVHDVCVALGVSLVVVNANDERWRWRRVKRKTDRDDALKLARLALLDELRSVHMPDPPARQRRRLMLHRRSVVSRRTQSRNAIRSIFNQQGIALARGGKQWTIAGVAQLREYARPIDRCIDVNDLWRGRLQVELDLIAATDAQLKLLDAKLDELSNADDRTKLLRSFKGVGPRLSEAVVLYLDDPRRFKNAAEVACYAGLVPKQIESGQMSRNGHITGRGPGLLRSLLVEAAWTVYRCHDWAKAWVEKVSRGGRGRRKLAIVALARKILIICWGMLKTNTPFRLSAAMPAFESPVALE